MNDVDARLKAEQAEYEAKNADNPCEYCGAGNKGTVVEFEDGSKMLVHYGLWSYIRDQDGVTWNECHFCHRRTRV